MIPSRFVPRLAALMLLIGLLFTPAAGVPGTADPPPDPPIAGTGAGPLTVHAGPTRVDTAVSVSQATWPTGADRVYLTASDAWPDALAAGAVDDGPILLVPSAGVPGVVRDEIARLSPDEVIVLGGERAVPDWAVHAAAGGRPVIRLAGPDRHATSAAVARHTFPAGADSVYLARSDNYADALAAGGIEDGPVLLVPTRGPVPADVTREIARLNPDRVIALGSPSAVSDQMLMTAAAGRATGRLAGADRYATSAVVARHALATGTPGARPVIASGLSFADALAAGPVRGPVLLVPACGAVPGPVAEFLSSPSVTSVVLLGGPAAICDAIVETIASTADVVIDGHDHDNVDEFTIQGKAWPDKTVRYVWGPGTSDVGDWRSPITAAMRSWERVSGVRFIPGSNANSDVVIGFYFGCPRQNVCFGSNTLAHAIVGHRDDGGPHFVDFNDSRQWSTASTTPRGSFDLETVALHELGHTIGLGHTNVAGASLEAVYAGVRRSLHADDAGGAQRLYGSPTASPAPPTPPPGNPTITLARGGVAPSGYWYSVNLSGFAPGSSVALTCRDSVDPQGFYTRSISISGSGTGAHAQLCYSADGPDHWVTGGGVTSNRVAWGSSGGGSTPPPPPPSPSPTINLSRGGPAPHGYWYSVNLSGFSPGSTVTLTCRDSVDPQGFYTRSISISGSGTGAHAQLCYSADGPNHWVTSNTGHTSNTVAW